MGRISCHCSTISHICRFVDDNFEHLTPFVFRWNEPRRYALQSAMMLNTFGILGPTFCSQTFTHFHQWRCYTTRASSACTRFHATPGQGKSWLRHFHKRVASRLQQDFTQLCRFYVSKDTQPPTHAHHALSCSQKGPQQSVTKINHPNNPHCQSTHLLHM